MTRLEELDEVRHEEDAAIVKVIEEVKQAEEEAKQKEEEPQLKVEAANFNEKEI